MTQLITETEIDPVTGKGRVSHIVAPRDNKSAQVLVMEAMLEGTPVEALCGHTWVPSRDPKQYPPCTKCIEVWENRFGSEQGLPDA